MAPPRVEPGLLAKVMDAISRRRALDFREHLLRRVTDVFYASGFERVRYYEVGQEVLPHGSGQKTFYLIWQHATAQAPDLEVEIGHRIPLPESTLFDEHVSGLLPPRTGDAVAPRPRESWPKWVEPLGLEGRYWVDIGVYHGSELIGVLSLDWSEPGFDLDDSGTTTLMVLGRILGSEMSATEPIVKSELQRRLQRLYLDLGLDELELVTQAVEIFQNTLHISSTAVFRYDWSRQRLVRIEQHLLAGPGGGRGLDTEEFDVGAYLTGVAWQDPGYRRVIDFPALGRERPELISPTSLAFHDGSVGPVESVMYAVIGDREPRYLLRMINDHKHPRRPFLTQYDVLQEFARDLAPLVDRLRAEQRSEMVNRVHADVAAAAGVPSDAMDITTRVAADLNTAERLSDVVVIAQRGTDKPHFFWASQRTEVAQLRESVARDPLFDQTLGARAGIHILPARDLRGLASLFRETRAEDSDLGAIKFSSGQTRGLLLFPVRGDGWVRSQRRTLVSNDVNEFLAQMCAAIAQSVDQAVVAAQARGVLQALSLVGHEMTTPLAAMTQITRRVMDIAHDGRRPARTDIDRLAGRLAYQTDTLEAALRLGHLVGRQSDGRLVGAFRRTSVAALINRSVYRTNSEIQGRSLMTPRDGIRITRPVGTTHVTLACDAPLVESALVNLYRNAVKYSVEQPVGIPVVATRVEVVRIGKATFVDLAVTNTGIAIPDFHDELVFEAFARFAAPVDDVTRRGMGLGLYLARQIARAHGGDATLRSHRPSPRRNGFETTFVLRLSTELEEGPYDKRVR